MSGNHDVVLYDLSTGRPVTSLASYASPLDEYYAALSGYNTQPIEPLHIDIRIWVVFPGDSSTGMGLR